MVKGNRELTSWWAVIYFKATQWWEAARRLLSTGLQPTQGSIISDWKYFWVACFISDSDRLLRFHISFFVCALWEALGRDPAPRACRFYTPSAIECCHELPVYWKRPMFLYNHFRPIGGWAGARTAFHTEASETYWYVHHSSVTLVKMMEVMSLNIRGRSKSPSTNRKIKTKMLLVRFDRQK